MKIAKIITSMSAAVLTAMLIFTGCSDQFLKDKKDYKKTNEGYDSYIKAKATINGIYAWALPSAAGTFDWQYPSSGSSDMLSKSTEEYTGLSALVDDEIIITTRADGDLPNFFYNERKASRNIFGFILACNDAIEGLTDNDNLTDAQENELLGQAYFFRAWLYYRLVKEYGGVPLVKEPQNPIGENVEALTIPRSSTKECIDFICVDLDSASRKLPKSWTADDFGRVTSGAALALKGRTRLLYASPLFNRADDKARWDLAYEANQAAVTLLENAGFGLAASEAPGINASGWGAMFSDFYTKEAVFATYHNNANEGTNTNPQKWNSWENSIRPLNANGSSGGGKVASATMIDLFPMADGKRPGESEDFKYGKIGDDGKWIPENLFMLNRDPRFYRTFAFPGVYWRFSGDPNSGKGATAAYPYTGANYALWNYTWYADAASREDEGKSGYSGEGLAETYKGVYVRKRTDDLDINSTPLYVFKADKNNGFRQSAAPYMEMRYAEVLLNFAESACGAGHYTEALEALRDIRKRVGYTGDCGLDDALANDRAKLFEAVLYERQIELAYEGKRFDDMRRWMLWDGGAGQASIKASWALTGFGGNTCTYLGVEPFNGQRRENLELCVAEKDGVIGNASAKDPYLDTRPAAWDLAKYESPSDELKEFYTNNLVRKQRRGDAKDAKGALKVVSFKPQYYFIGLKSNAQTSNPTLEQTIGWDDIMQGGQGTFDPLAD